MPKPKTLLKETKGKKKAKQQVCKVMHKPN